MKEKENINKIFKKKENEHISAAAIIIDNESDSFTCSLALYMVCLFAPSVLMPIIFFIKIKTLLGPTKIPPIM